MAVNGYDVQICLWKILKLSSETCVTFSTRHPFFACFLLLLFLLYALFPLVFWILIYSFPVVVCTWIAFSNCFTLRNGKKYEEEENDSKNCRKVAHEFEIHENKKSFSRVHSVRRRRAKDIWTENNTKSKAEEKNAVCSTNSNHDVVDKNALSEESPKEIREVEVDQNSQVSITKGNSSPVYRIGILKDLIQDDEEKDDDEEEQKNAMDIGISEVERNKRLESLIARRRSRKLLSLQVRRSLMNMDRNDQTFQFPSLIIPRLHSSVPSPFSPGPGSAPSVLVPMRNPFDLPYDPQEEKPDLTRDSFQQEFLPVNNNSRDMMFCRHESFSLGVFTPGEFNYNREGTSFIREKRDSFRGNQHCKRESEFEQKSNQVSEAKPTSEATDDHIKEIIEVYDDDTTNQNEEHNDDVQKRQDFASSSSSQSSSEEDEPVYKIDKEAILKSLSSMVRRNVVEETENGDQEGDGGQLDYDEYLVENSVRLNKQFYHAGKTTRRHAPSYSIASDLQVEVSEVSSPPTTIDENFSYHDENMSMYDEDMEKKFGSDNEGLWARSSHLSEVDENESRSMRVTEVTKEDVIGDRFSRIDGSTGINMSNSTEEPSNEIHSVQPCLQIPSEDEFRDSSRGRATNLDEKIHQTLQRSISSKAKSHGNDSGKPMDNNINQIEESARMSDEHMLGQHETSHVCKEMDQLSTRSIKSPEDLEETIENNVNIESIQRVEGEQSSTGVNMSDEHISGLPKTSYECKEMEQLSTKSIKSSEDLEETVENNGNIESIQCIEGEQSSAKVNLSDGHILGLPETSGECKKMEQLSSKSIKSSEDPEETIENHVNIKSIQCAEGEQSSIEINMNDEHILGQHLTSDESKEIEQLSTKSIKSSEIPEETIKNDVSIKSIRRIEDEQSSTEVNMGNEHILGLPETSDECKEMEQLSTKSIKSSEDPKDMTENHVNIISIQSIEGEQSSAEVNMSDEHILGLPISDKCKEMEQLSTKSVRSSEDPKETIDNHVNTKSIQRIEGEQSSVEVNMSDEHILGLPVLDECKEMEQLSTKSVKSSEDPEEMINNHVNIESILRIEGEQSSAEVNMSDEHILGLPEKSDECKEMEQLSTKSIKSSEDSEETIDNHVNIESIQRIEGEQNSAEVNMREEHIVGPHVTLDECKEMEQLSTKSIRSSEDPEETLENDVNIESIHCTEGEQTSTEINTTQTTPFPDDPQASSLMQDEIAEQFHPIQSSSLLSPKSVLLPTLSMGRGFVSSSDHDIDEDVPRFSTQTTEVSSPVVVMEQSTALPCYNGDVELSQESAEPLTMLSMEADDDTENAVEPKEGTDDSSQRRGTHEAPPHHTDDSISLLAIEASFYGRDDKQESSENHEKVIEEPTGDVHCNKSRSNETKMDEPQHFDTDESHIVVSGLVEDYENSESCSTTNSHESKAIPEDKLENINTFDGENK